MTVVGPYDSGVVAHNRITNIHKENQAVLRIFLNKVFYNVIKHNTGVGGVKVRYLCALNKTLPGHIPDFVGDVSYIAAKIVYLYASGSLCPQNGHGASLVGIVHDPGISVKAVIPLPFVNHVQKGIGGLSHL